MQKISPQANGIDRWLLEAGSSMAGAMLRVSVAAETGSTLRERCGLRSSRNTLSANHVVFHDMDKLSLLHT